MIRIVVLNWNGRRWLEGCLRALQQQDGPPFEVVVVDNASTDGSADYVREHFPDVLVMALATNVGFAAGNNRGARGFTGRYLVFLNNDTVVQPGWLAAMADAAERDAGIGMVAAQIVYLHDPDIVDSLGDGYLRAGGAFKHQHGQRRAPRGEHREVFGACGASLLIRTALFERLGGFDEDYFMVYEDVDLSYRARLAGSRCVVATSAIVWHAGSASLGRTSANAVYLGQRNLEWTWLKNTPAALLWRSLPAHVFYDLAGLAAYARAGLIVPWFRGKLAAIAGLPSVWRKRRAVVSDRQILPNDLWRQMSPDWIGIKRWEKAFDLVVTRGGSTRVGP